MSLNQMNGWSIKVLSKIDVRTGCAENFDPGSFQLMDKGNYVTESFAATFIERIQGNVK
jgi:hypothetical protein